MLQRKPAAEIAFQGREGMRKLMICHGTGCIANGAAEVTADTRVRSQIRRLQDEGYGALPVCVAKTQYSFSTDPLLRGAPSGHVVNVREVRLAAGAEFVVMICGDMMTMPGLPREPAAQRIDVLACEIAQPMPVKAASFTTPFSICSSMVISSPQLGLCPLSAQVAQLK